MSSDYFGSVVVLLIMVLFLIGLICFIAIVIDDDQQEILKHVTCKDLKFLQNDTKISGHQNIKDEYATRC